MAPLRARQLARAARARVKTAVGRPSQPAAPSSEEPDPFWRLVTDDSLWPSPFDFYEEMHRVGPIYRSRYDQVVAVGFEAVSTLLKEERAHTVTDIDDATLLGVGTGSIIRKNPPRHGELRRLMGKGFGPRSITRLTGVIENECDRLLDLATEKGEFDAVGDYALPLAVRVIASILGMPPTYDDRLRRLGPAVSRLIDPWLTPEQWEITKAASVEILDCFRELIDERRRSPGDDLITTMLDATETDVALTEKELLANCEFILLAGFETTVGMLGSAINILVGRPDVWQLLQDRPDLVPNTIEEVLRMESPVQMVQRVAMEDIEIAGYPVAKGLRVIGIVGAANRDPSTFAEPDVFDPMRDNANRHLAFLVGPHHCLGSSLARLEGQVALTKMMERMPEIRRKSDAVRRPHLVVRGLAQVPVEVVRS
jgi:cytochrome P450